MAKKNVKNRGPAQSPDLSWQDLKGRVGYIFLNHICRISWNHLYTPIKNKNALMSKQKILNQPQKHQGSKRLWDCWLVCQTLFFFSDQALKVGLQGLRLLRQVCRKGVMSWTLTGFSYISYSTFMRVLHKQRHRIKRHGTLLLLKHFWGVCKSAR